MKTETIKKILTKTFGRGNDAIIEVATGYLIAAEADRAKVAILHKKIAEERQVRDEVIRMLNEDLAAIQKNCCHPAQTHFTGSGNNDSYSQCDICGVQFP